MREFGFKLNYIFAAGILLFCLAHAANAQDQGVETLCAHQRLEQKGNTLAVSGPQTSVAYSHHAGDAQSVFYDSTGKEPGLTRFVDRLFDTIDSIRNPGRHAEQQDVHSAAGLSGHARIKAALEWIAAHSPKQTHKQRTAPSALSAEDLRFAFESDLSETLGQFAAASAREQHHALIAGFKDLSRSNRSSV